jgi:PEP-CTERM motif-containing protein
MASMPASAELILAGGSSAFGTTITPNNFGVAAANNNGAVLDFDAGQTTSKVGALLVYNPDGSSSYFLDTTVSDYRGADDFLVGVLDRNATAIASVTLHTGTHAVFGFDGDGIDTLTKNASNVVDKTTYGGPLTFFTGLNAAHTAGTANFLGNLGSGQSTYFSLETTQRDLVDGLNGPGGSIVFSAVPEPSTVLIGAIGVLSGLLYARRRRLAA